MSRPISSLSEDDTDTDDYPADNELSSNLPMHADEDDADDKENHHPLINQHQPTLLPPLALPTTSAFSSPTKRPPHKRHRPSPSSTAAAAVSPSHDPNLVLLDIGGILFKTSLSTLLSIPNTYFTAHLTFAQQPQPGSSSGSGSGGSQPLFIDRDAAHFRHVLNYMRDRSLPDGLTLREVNELYREATYYAIDELKEQIDRLRTELKQRDEEAERRRETERLLLQASASERQQIWPNRSLSNPLELVAAGMAAPMGGHTAQRAVSTAAVDFRLDADF